MRHLIALAFLCLLACTGYSQNCFNEQNNVVSSLACVNAQATFEMNEKAAQIAKPNQYVFASVVDGKKQIAPSWDIMDRSGKFFNIHQFGFKYVTPYNSTRIGIVYKIVNSYETAEVAITIDNDPVYHGFIKIMKETSTNLYTTTDIGRYMNLETPFTLILENGNSLVGFKLGSMLFSKVSNDIGKL